MDDAAQRRHFALHAAHQMSNLIRLGDVHGKFVNRDTGLPQTPERQSCIGRGGLAAPDDGEMAGTFPNKPLGGCKAEPRTASGDEIARYRRKLEPSFGCCRDGCRTITRVDRQDDLANMPRVLHATECLGGSRDREDPMRQRDKSALLEKRSELGEKLAGESRTINQQSIDIDPKELDIIAERLQSDLVVGKEVALPEFDETSVGPEDRDSFGDRLPGDRIQYDVDTLAICNLADVIGKGERPRIDDVLHPEPAEKLALFS